MLGGEGSPLTDVVPVAVSLAALMAWAILPVVAAVAWFRRIDLNE
jgi:hypothetical protein